MYGMGAQALSKILKCSVNEAGAFLKSFLSAFPDVNIWMKRTERYSMENLFVSTIAGRRRFFKDASEAKFLAVNTVVQGSSSDIMKLALIGLHKRLPKSGIDCIMVSTVHDEIVVEVRREHVVC